MRFSKLFNCVNIVRSGVGFKTTIRSLAASSDHTQKCDSKKDQAKQVESTQDGKVSK